MKNFWTELKKPIFALAPMANVTDAAFRFIIAKYSKFGGRDIGDGSQVSLPFRSPPGADVGGPDVFFTEFTSCDGLMSAGRDKLLVDLKYSPGEHPIVAQFFGSVPENFRACAALARELGFDGVDINMGCPDRAVEKQGAGAALIKNPELAKKLIQAAKEGAGDLPVSVKTRLGYNKIILEEWLPELLSETPAAITIHARTRKEMSAVPAHWDQVKRAVEIRDKMGSQTLILGNGDVQNLAEAQVRVRETGCDGVMIGRGIFGNPWLFCENAEIKLTEKFRVMLEHTRLFETMFAGVKSFDVMKKHYKAYVAGFDGAKELRTALMEARSAGDVEQTLRGWTKPIK